MTHIEASSLCRDNSTPSATIKHSDCLFVKVQLAIEELRLLPQLYVTTRRPFSDPLLCCPKHSALCESELSALRRQLRARTPGKSGKRPADLAFVVTYELRK
jgi:hypothetical protein